MFSPVARRRLSAIERRWERRLRREGLPDEIRPLTASSERDGLRVVPLRVRFSRLGADGDEIAALDDWWAASAANFAAFGTPTPTVNTATAVFWRRFSAAVWSLDPRRWSARERRFLCAVSETGNVEAARRQLRPRMGRNESFRIITRFREECLQ